MRHVFRLLRLIGIRTHRSFRLSLRFVAIFVGLYSAFRVAILIQQGHFEPAEFWHIAVILAAIGEFILADVLADHSFPFDTERKLALMERRLGQNAIDAITRELRETISQLRGCNRELVSATVHLVVELAPTTDHRFRQGLLQLTDYVGAEGGKKGRLTLTTQGVIGRCARTGRRETVGFADEAEYSDAMVREFGFSKQEAARHTKTGRSYLAVPLLHDQLVFGVLYIFTSESQVFPRAAASTDFDRTARFIREMVDVIGLT
jgi:hypothetical protein